SVVLVLHASTAPRHLHSFPTRRSSDLSQGAVRSQPGLLPRTIAGGVGCGVDRRSYRHLLVLRTTDPAGTSGAVELVRSRPLAERDRKSTRLNSSHVSISYAVFCLKKKN